MYKNIYWDLINQKKSLAIVGLGYVGLPLAIAFSEKLNVVGFDIDAQKINNYVNGKDITGEVGSDAIKNAKIKFTSDENDLKYMNQLYILESLKIFVSLYWKKNPDLNVVLILKLVILQKE